MWSQDSIFLGLKLGIRKDLALHDKPAAYQLVGGVKAHQGEDG